MGLHSGQFQPLRSFHYKKNGERLDGVAYRLAEKFLNGDIGLEALINLAISAGWLP